jgi:hypothetical protein
MTSADFAAKVQAVLGPLLMSLGFTLNEVDDGPDEGGIPRHIAYYQSNDCKLQIYDSSREGEVNCMIAPLTAHNQYGLTAKDWHYISRFSKRSNLPPEERLRAAIAEAKAYDDQFDYVKDRIAKHYEAAHAGILQKYPAGHGP